MDPLAAYGAMEGIVGTAAELFTLLLISVAFVLISLLAYKTKSRRTFQFEMFLFTLVLVLAEVPRVVYSLELVDLDWLQTAGLLIHTVSMAILSLFVGYRIYGFFRSETVGK